MEFSVFRFFAIEEEKGVYKKGQVCDQGNIEGVVFFESPFGNPKHVGKIYIDGVPHRKLPTFFIFSGYLNL
ncbi:MAG: hypothetical protein ACLQDI_23900 [Syntrophobacteraceae bacterium]